MAHFRVNFTFTFTFTSHLYIPWICLYKEKSLVCFLNTFHKKHLGQNKTTNLLIMLFAVCHNDAIYHCTWKISFRTAFVNWIFWTHRLTDLWAAVCKRTLFVINLECYEGIWITGYCYNQGQEMAAINCNHKYRWFNRFVVCIFADRHTFHSVMPLKCRNV